jgi:hypothetical protein
LEEEKPFKHLPEDADDRDWAEVVRISFPINVFAQEVNLGLIPLSGRSPLMEALVVEFE